MWIPYLRGTKGLCGPDSAQSVSMSCLRPGRLALALDTGSAHKTVLFLEREITECECRPQGNVPSLMPLMLSLRLG